MFQQIQAKHPQLLDLQRKDTSVEPSQYFQILVKNWLVVLTSMLVGLLLALGLSALLTAKYESTASLYVSVRAGTSGANDDLLQGASFAQTAVTSYIDVATTAVVLDKVAQELNNDFSIKQLKDRLTVSSPPDSVLIEITAQDADPQVAAAIANTTGDVFIDVVENEIEISDAGGDSPIQVRIIDPGQVPSDPTSPKLWLNGLAGIVLGGLIGIGIAVLRGITDTRIHTIDGLEQLTDVPVVGGIANDDHISHRPLVVHDDPGSPRAEAFRILRTNLQFLGAGDSTRVFMVSSATPGEGKTHVVGNLAVVLAQSGARVALVEADLRKPRLAQLMGIEGAVGMSDVLIGAAELEDVVQPWGTDDLLVLPAGRVPPNPSELLGSHAMKTLLEDLEQQVDYVLIDAPPILPVTDAIVLSGYTSGTLLVTAIGQTKRHDFQQAMEAMQHIEGDVLGLIGNKLSVKSSDMSGITAYRYTDTDTPAKQRIP